jgi:hypothetical protein
LIRHRAAGFWTAAQVYNDRFDDVQASLVVWAATRLARAKSRPGATWALALR